MLKRIFAVMISVALLIPAAALCVPVNAAETADGVSSYLTDKVTSPDGSITAFIGLDTNGEIRYTVQRDGRTVIFESPMGLVEKNDNFASGFSKTSFTVSREINEKYTLLTGKKSENINNYIPAKLMLKSTGGASFAVEMRAYNDGFAFRYTISSRNAAQFNFTDEKSGYTIGNDWMVCHSDFYKNDYETLYVQNTANELDDKSDFFNSMYPLTYQTSQNDYVFINEANLSGEYTGTVLNPAVGTDTTSLKVSFTPSQTTAVVSAQPFSSPWRYAVIGDLSAVIENTMADNLADEPDKSIDYSFVESAATSWSWIDNGLSNQQEAQHDTELIKSHIDLAAEMGWGYYLLDEGWQKTKYPPAYYDSFDEIMSYAKSKNIKIIVWVHSDDLSTEALRNERLEKWAASGVAGIKVDFFDNENQQTMKLYEAIYKRCAELKMVVNCHGANKATGESRTYPNVLTREGIRGQEYGNVRADDYVYLAYTRLAAGVTDITEYINPRSSSLTAGFQIALSFMTTSGIHTFAGGAEEYASECAQNLYKNWNCKFDDTKFLCGEIGESVVMARKSGDVWFAAGMANTEYTADFDLSFLDSGNYVAEIYNDGANYNDLTKTVSITDNSQTMNLDIMNGGGFVVKFTKADENVRGASAVSLTLPKSAAEIGESLKCTADVTVDEGAVNDINWTSSNTKVATVSNSGTVTALSVGKTVIRVQSALDSKVYDTAELIVTLPKYEINTTDWKIYNKIDDNMSVIGGVLKIQLVGGDPGSDTGIKNRFGMTPSDNDFTIKVKTTGNMSNRYDTVALYVMSDSNNIVAAMRRYHDGLGLSDPHCFEILKYENGYNEPAVVDTQKNDDVWMMLEKRGNSYTAYYSYDDFVWVLIGSQTVSGSLKDAVADKLEIGVYTTNGVGGSSNSAELSDFIYTAAGASTQSDISFLTEKDYSESFKKGDIDSDGSVTVSDVVALRKMIMTGEWDNFSFMAADMDEDYTVTVSDVVALRKMIMMG